MFGHRKPTQLARATVVLVTEINGHTSGAYGYETHRFNLIVDVHPDHEAPFRAEAHEWFPSLYSPRVGDEVTVRFDPGSKDVEFVIEGDIRFDMKLKEKTKKAHEREERQRLLGGEPGSH
jgi:hypothetical protein